MDQKCKTCGDPNIDDRLSPDGDCFVCEVEADTATMPPELVPTYLDAISKAIGRTPEVPSSGRGN